MDIVILNKSEKPIYEQIYQQIACNILNGVIEADFCLPSIREIARELSVSVITVKKAYEMLENDGLIYTRTGKGCFVLKHSINNLKNKKQALLDEQIKKDILFYKSLDLSLNEMIELIKKNY